jgi:hypothetical protein
VPYVLPGELPRLDAPVADHGLLVAVLGDDLLGIPASHSGVEDPGGGGQDS